MSRQLTSVPCSCRHQPDRIQINARSGHTHSVPCMTVACGRSGQSQRGQSRAGSSHRMQQGPGAQGERAHTDAGPTHILGALPRTGSQHHLWSRATQGSATWGREEGDVATRRILTVKVTWRVQKRRPRRTVSLKRPFPLLEVILPCKIATTTND